MVRKGESTLTSNHSNRTESAGRSRTSPVVLLKRINIPLNSTVLVKGDSVICPKDSPSRESEVEGDVVDISGSDNSEDEEFQKLIVKRFQSTRGNDIYKQIESFPRAESFSFKQTPFLETSYPGTSKLQSSVRSEKPGPASRKKLIAQKNVIKRKSMQMSNTPGRVDKVSTNVNKKNTSSSKIISSGKKTFTTGPQSIKTSNKQQSPNLKKEDANSPLLTSSLVPENHDRLNKTSFSKENILQNKNVDEHSKEQPSLDQTVLTSNNKTDFTPSRTSERIKNKKVKFSALKLLAGGDFQAMKRELNARKHSTPKKTVITKTSNSSDINANNSEISSPEKEEPLSVSNKTVFEGKSMSPKTSPGSKNEKSKARKSGTINKGTPKSRKQQHLTKNSDDKPQEETHLKKNENVVDEQPLDINHKSDVTENLSGVKTGGRLNGSKEILMKSPSSSREESSTLKRVSDKVKVQLKDIPEKKVVNISVAPSKVILKNKDSSKVDSKQKLNLELGPDIVIKRVRSNKNQSSDTVEESTVNVDRRSEKAAGKSKLSIEEAILSKQLFMSNNLRIKNLIYTKQSAKSGSKPIKEVEVPPQIRKLLVEASKNKKSLTPRSKETSATEDDPVNTSEAAGTSPNRTRKKKLWELNRKKLVHGKKVPDINKSEMSKNRSRKESDEHSASDQEMEHDDIELEISELLDSSIEDDATKEKAEFANKSSADNKLEENKKSSKSVDIFSPNVGKKTAKVTPLRQAIKIPPRSDVVKKFAGDKVTSNSEIEYKKNQKSNTIDSNSHNEISILGSKRNYRNAFEKYFICTDKICEHNDSLDSDSSVEVIDFLSHFVDLKGKGNEDGSEDVETEDTSRLEADQKGKNATNQAIEMDKGNNVITSGGKGTINDMIRGVTADLPNWSCHIPPESSATICLILLDRDTNGTLALKKCIEIDSNFKANVYVNRELVSEYCGVYDSFDSIRNLIYQVDLL
uniref:Uncharacterized protein n=1 Tax=Rhodnius prolixus TaxID=13249 RepID=T1I0B1_RHOPR